MDIVFPSGPWFKKYSLCLSAAQSLEVNYVFVAIDEKPYPIIGLENQF